MITASEIIDIKSKIKAEMTRRSGYGALNEFGGESYDFATTPTADSIISAEQGQKVVDLLLKITDLPNLQNVTEGEVIPSGFDYNSMNEAITTYATEEMTGSSSS